MDMDDVIEEKMKDHVVVIVSCYRYADVEEFERQCYLASAAMHIEDRERAMRRLDQIGYDAVCDMVKAEMKEMTE